MDPYLESPIGWPDVHASLVSAIRELLAAGVEPDYFVRIEERLYITDPETDGGFPKLVPDVMVTTRPQPQGQPGILVWFIDLRDRLPTVGVPLRDPDPDVPLDLQQAFDTAYDRARYAHSVDYTRPIPPPLLKPADAAWVARQVEAARKRDPARRAHD
jgi:hypothetical protein